MAWLRICCGVRIKVIGPRCRDLEPYVVMAKHQSTWETLYLHHHFAPISPIVKKELLAIPFFGWGLASLRPIAIEDRKSTRLNSSHVAISYAVFCLKKQIY